ncbi:MAG TPA: BtpA/SgcQ family protein [Ktedonobacteraceae bacterium]|jgi:membrane complex biogenesis BtpA family protein|nr:BtpA/SgcQ family protein [Ktedonobacteraceae bacterium]
MATTDWMKRHPLIGVVGIPALPGAINYRGATREELIQRAVADAQAYAQAGFDALMIQNVGDLPVAARVGPETVAWLSMLGAAIRSAIALPLGVCVLKNDGCAALAIAQAIGAVFVRVKVWVGAMVGAEGIVQGSARSVLRYRRLIGAEEIAIVADVHDRTGVPLAGMTLEEAAHEAVWFGKADGLVITGRNEAETLDWLQRVDRVMPDVPIWAGGGVTPTNISRFLAVADGAIIATAAKVGGQLLNPVDRQAGEALTRAAGRE